jgi:hypothetical protein
MKNIKFVFPLLLAVIFMPGISLAGEAGSALKADIIRVEPYTDAKKAGNMARGEKLEIINKKGAWLKVKTAKAGGWVRLLAVKRGGGSGGNEATGVLALASGRAGTGKVVATSGVRGLNEEDLKKASYNETEVIELESYTQNSQQGRQFAYKGRLKAVKFDYLQEGGEK